MTKQVINVGASANDKQGDSLRAAFQKVNANFTELYTELGLANDVTLSLGAFEFTGSTMTTTDSTAIVIDQATTITSNLSVGGDLLPQTANGGDLGSSTLPWRSLYVSNNTIYIGGTAVGIDANGSLTVNSSPVTGDGANLGTLKIEGSTLGTQGQTDNSWGNYNLYLDPGGESNAYINIPSVPNQEEGNALQIFNKGDATSIVQVFGQGSVQIVTNTGEGEEIFEFRDDGNLQLPASGIITTADNAFFKLQAKDTNSALRNEITLDPNNGTFMNVWGTEQNPSYSFASGSWSTASWQNNGGQGYVLITNAEDLADFWTAGAGSFVSGIEVSINGGARTSVTYYGDNEEQYDVELSVNAVPVSSPTTITSLTFYYRAKSIINIDYDAGEMLLNAQQMPIKLKTDNNINLESGGNLNIRGLSLTQPVRIYANNNTRIWEFGTDGSLTLPREGKIYGIGDGAAGDRYGYISWDGNSSGDGLGYNTMRLVPDLQGLEDLDQYIILDPTSPGHIHIRAGGTQDNSLADLYLGGENSHIKIGAGANPPVTVMADDNSWIFGTDGTLTAPGEVYGQFFSLRGGNPSGTIGSLGYGGDIIVLNGLNGVKIEAGDPEEGPLWDFGTDGTTLFPSNSIKNSLGSNTAITTQRTLTANNSYTNGVDFSTDVDLGGGTIIAGWYQRNLTQIEFALFGPSAFVSYLTGLALGRTVIVTYSTAGGNQTLTRTLTQAFTSTGQNDPANPAWYRVSGRIDATLPEDQTGIVSVNFPVYTTSTNNWTFGSTGTLTFPDSSVQTSAWTGVADLARNIEAEGDVNIRVNLTDSTTRIWRFGEDGLLTFPDGTNYSGNDITVPSGGIPTGVSNINSQGGYNIGSYTGLATSGGTGTGLTVNASTAGNGYIDTVTINTAGTGYTDGDVITLVGGDGFGCTFIITVSANTWTFGTDGRTIFPNGVVPEHSYGAAGDKEGMVVFDNTYIYYCTADYVNNSTDIWKRTAHGAGTW
jgi:hypothetical protein